MKRPERIELDVKPAKPGKSAGAIAVGTTIQSKELQKAKKDLGVRRRCG